MSSPLPHSILIVDDDEAVRRALQVVLRTEGYTLHVAHDANQGLAVLKEHPIDLILSDHVMPEMTGLEFLKLVRDRYPESMRLMLTGTGDLETAIDAINEGNVHRFLTKPWDDTELKVTLSLAFEQLDAERENRRLAAMVRRQYDQLTAVDVEHPGLGHVRRDAQGRILIGEDHEGLRANIDVSLRRA